MFKHLRLLTAVGLIALSGLAQAQTSNTGTGGCPTSQFVNQVGSNIISQACAQPQLADVGGSIANHALLVGTGAGISTIAGGAGGTILGGVSGSNPAFTATPSGLTSLEATTLNAGKSGTAGTLGVFPATASTGSTTVTATANSGNTVTNINTAAQAGARTYTVPDAGGSADFLLTAGSQSSTTGLTLTPLRMTDMRTAAGVMMTTSASGTNFGLTVAGGTNALLTGTATSSGSTSDVAYIEFVLPPWYIAGTNLTIGVSCYYTNSSSSATVHTMTAAGYLENTTSGAQGSNLIASGAVTCPITTASNQTVTLTGTTLVPGSYVALTLSAAVTNGGGASTEFLTGVTFQ